MVDKDILNIIRKSGATRTFRKKLIADSIIKKIIEGGRWGPSILGIQPWRIISITNDKVKMNISRILSMTAEDIDQPFNIILKITSKTIADAKCLIAIYNNKKVVERARKYGEPYIHKSNIAEIQAIGGAIQNMVLETNSLGLGCVWLDSPTFFNENDINKTLRERGSLIAFLAIGYPTSKAAKRSRRAPYREMVKIIK